MSIVLRHSGWVVVAPRVLPPLLRGPAERESPQKGLRDTKKRAIKSQNDDE